jgi:hypothetical protein
MQISPYGPGERESEVTFIPPEKAAEK